MQEASINRFRTNYLHLLVACLLVGLVGAAVLSRSALAKQLQNWQVSPQPERFTELYFTNYQQLPSMVDAGAAQSVQFTVRSFEHQATVYHYVIVAKSAAGGDAQQLAAGTFTIAQGNSQKVGQSVAVPALGARVVVWVTLSYSGIAFGAGKPTAQTQSIHYSAAVANFSAGGQKHYESP